MARYFFNISELLDAGQSIDDVKIEVYYDENKASYDGPAEVRGPISTMTQAPIMWKLTGVAVLFTVNAKSSLH